MGWQLLVGESPERVRYQRQAYLLLQMGRLDAADVRYSAGNGLGAALVLVSLGFEFNLSAFLVEAFWLVISIGGLVKARRAATPGD